MRKSLPYITLFVFFSIFLLSGCGDKRPNGVLSKGQMEDVLYDYHLAKVMGDNLPSNDNYKQKYYIESVFMNHGITEAQFDSSLVWYSRHAEDMAEIYKNLQSRLKADMEKINKSVTTAQQNSKGASSGDSINIWTLNKTIRFNGFDLHNSFTFSYSADSTFHDRDIFEWSVNFICGGNIDMMHAATMALTVQYVNDSTITRTTQVTGSGMRVLRVQNDMPNGIRSVKGFIYMPKGSQGILVGRVNSLMRYHAHGSAPAASGAQPNANTHPTSLPFTPAADTQTHEINTTPQVVGPDGKAVPVSPNKADSSKNQQTTQPNHRLSPEEMNRKRQDNSEHGYQKRQEELQKQLMQLRRGRPTYKSVTQPHKR